MLNYRRVSCWIPIGNQQLPINTDMYDVCRSFEWPYPPPRYMGTRRSLRWAVGNLPLTSSHSWRPIDDGKCDTSHPAPKYLSQMLPSLKWFEEGLKSCNIGPLFWIGGRGLAGGSQDFRFSIWTLKDHSHRPKLTVWFLDLDEAILIPIIVFGNINLLRPKKSDAKTHLKGKLLEFLLWILCCSHCNHWGQRTSRNCLAVLSRTLGSAQTWETPKK